ncbi:MAG: ParA family protein [Deltaproteobacteria bacterium]|nr:ParA family protein [Deltaproteobacteria bacterium]
MIEIIGFCNQKGGVGKTTTAINLAASVADQGRHALLIDLDPQSNTTTGLGFQKNSVISNSYNLVIDNFPPNPVKTALPNLDLIPSTSDLVAAEANLYGMSEKEFRLKKALQAFQGDYDFVFIDAPPSLGLLTINILAAATSIIVPVQCEYYALEGLTDLLQTIDAVREKLNPALDISGILLTMYDRRNNLAKEVESDLRNHFVEKVFKTVIPRSVRLSEAPSHGKPIILYDPYSSGSQSYQEVAREFLERIKTKEKEEGGEEKWKERRLVGGLQPSFRQSLR